MKPLKPSHREHKRYLLISGSDANPRVIEEAILGFVGILGYAKATPSFVKASEKNAGKFRGKLVLAINRKELENIRASLVFSGKQVVIERVSGTIRGL